MSLIAAKSNRAAATRNPRWTRFRPRAPGQLKPCGPARSAQLDDRPGDARLPRVRLPLALRPDGRTLTWWCARGCPSHGEKTYATAGEANRMADSLDREPRGPLGFLDRK